MLAGMCHCRGLGQGRDLAAGLPGRPVVIFQLRNLPELFPACCRIRSASPEHERHRMSRGWAQLMWLCCKYTPGVGHHVEQAY